MLDLDPEQLRQAQAEGERMALGRVAKHACGRCRGTGIIGVQQDHPGYALPCGCTGLIPDEWYRIYSQVRLRRPDPALPTLDQGLLPRGRGVSWPSRN